MGHGRLGARRRRRPAASYTQNADLVRVSATLLPDFQTRVFLRSPQSVARALVPLRVRGQMERQWDQEPSHLPEGQVQRALWLKAMH